MELLCHRSHLLRRHRIPKLIPYNAIKPPGFISKGLLHCTRKTTIQIAWLVIKAVVAAAALIQAIRWWSECRGTKAPPSPYCRVGHQGAGRNSRFDTGNKMVVNPRGAKAPSPLRGMHIIAHKGEVVKPKVKISDYI